MHTQIQENDTVTLETRHVIAGQQALQVFTLSNNDLSISISNLGATILSVWAPGRDGEKRNIAAGFATPEEYFHNEYYFGCIVGRFANRIAGGKFSLDGQDLQLTVNNNGNHLHGGFQGFHAKIWEISSLHHRPGMAGIGFRYVSPHNEEGYPGTMETLVQYELHTDNKLVIRYEASSDRTTPVNLTNHSYFNLSGFTSPDILSHEMEIHAHAYTEKGPNNIPTGTILPVKGTALDFTAPRKIGDRIRELTTDQGYDHNFVLQPAAAPALAASVYEPESGRSLNVYTDRPGIQLYTANAWDGSITGAQGVPYTRHGAFALETQAFPDSVNHPHFPGAWLHPGETFRSTTIFEFGAR